MAFVAGSRQFRGEQDLTVRVRFALGVFTLRRDEAGALFRTSIRYERRYFTPINEYSQEQRFLDVGIESRTDDMRIRRTDDLGQRAELALSPNVPVDISLEFGAGRVDVDLGGLSLSKAEIRAGAARSRIAFSEPTSAPCDRLDIAIGAAELVAEGLGNSNCGRMNIKGAAGVMTVDFTGEWLHEGVTEAEVTLGLGGLTLQLPTHIGVAVTLDRFLASFDRSGFTGSGDTLYSRNYEDTATRLHLDVKATLGNVDVVWVPR